jgi:signal transduction histidine kinase
MTKLPRIKARPTAAQIFAAIIAGIIAVSMVLTYGVIFVLLKLKIGTITAVVTSTTYMSIFTTIIGIGIAAYTSTKMLSPILKINDAAKKVSRGDFSVRLEEKSIAKEIEEIATSFNIMVKELSNTETLRSDFVSNVSHEFKTPLSAIEGYATLLPYTFPVSSKIQAAFPSSRRAFSRFRSWTIRKLCCRRRASCSTSRFGAYC